MTDVQKAELNWMTEKQTVGFAQLSKTQNVSIRVLIDRALTAYLAQHGVGVPNLKVPTKTRLIRIAEGCGVNLSQLVHDILCLSPTDFHKLNYYSKVGDSARSDLFVALMTELV